MHPYEITATCSLGLEKIVLRELQALGMENVRAENGQVRFSGGDRQLCQANMWLRSADRVWLVMAEFPCSTFEELFQGVKNVPWGDYIPFDGCFPVDAHSHSSLLTSIPAVQRTAKKAIVEILQKKYRRNNLVEDGTLFSVKINIVKDKCTVLMDASGSGLHRRGYRTLNAKAPLRETLAAALVQLSYWNKDRLLVDPFCGSGTILIESAMIGLNRAPGLSREFACEYWPFVPQKICEDVRREAVDAFDRTTKLHISGFDVDPEVLKLARIHLAQAGLENRGIHFQQQDIRDFSNSGKYGVIITNPPYGERLEDAQIAKALYSILGKKCSDLPTWSFYVISSHKEFAESLGLKVGRQRKLYNGMMECVYYQYPGPRPYKN